MPFHPEIYRSYDIRGVVPDELDAEEFYHVGRAYAVKFPDAKRVIVARDMRQSGGEFEPKLIEGLTDGGVSVLSIGMATTPMFYFAVHHLTADGGLMVTASHNPAQYNGVKMTKAEAVPVGGDTGLHDIRDLVEKRRWDEVEEKGVVEKHDVKKDYLDMVAKDVDASGLKIVVDAGNGMAGVLLQEYFDRVGGKAIALYWEPDGSFPNHEADPLKEENMQDLHKSVKEHKADLGVAFDGDGDRIFFGTEQGVTIPGDITTALIAQEVLREKPGSAVLYDLRASRATKEVIEEAGGIAHMSKVGHSNIKAHMRKVNAVFAGEVSGHLYFVPWYAESGFLAFGYMIRILQREKRPVSEIIKPFIRYAKSPEINFEVEDKQAALDRLKERYSDAEILELDGVSIVYDNWWANVRPSNTEPLLRLNMEADTKELLEKKRKEIESLLK